MDIIFIIFVYMKCRSDVFITLASVRDSAACQHKIWLALAFRKKWSDEFANAHVQSEVVHQFDVFLFIVSRQGHLCKGNLENRL